MLKHDKAIQQMISSIVLQIQECGKCFIQQVAARSSEKKEQLTAIQEHLQDALKDISQVGEVLLYGLGHSVFNNSEKFHVYCLFLGGITS